jgi:hypothetical protein
MLYRHEDKTLRGIEDDPDLTGGHSKDIVKAVLKVLRLIVRAGNENDLRAIKGATEHARRIGDHVVRPGIRLAATQNLRKAASSQADKKKTCGRLGKWAQ